MKRILMLTILVVVLGAFGSLGIQAANKVQVCHLPPGGPDVPDHAEATGWHTITVTENNLSAHLLHGDIAGSCNEACDTLCDDGNACTVDHHNDCEENGCLATPESVDCDDSLLCTSDTCDPDSGCQYAPIVCDDGDLCTADLCNPTDGQCIAAPKTCGTNGFCVPETGNCDYPCDGISCARVDQCHEPGTCVLPDGTCEDGPALADGTACDDGDSKTFGDQCTQGVCSGDSAVDHCPCDFSFDRLDCVLGTTGLTCSGASDRHLIVYGSGNTCDTRTYSNQNAIVEYVSVYNWDLGGLSTDPSLWPVCGVGEFFEAPPLIDHKLGLTQAEADACFEQLREWIYDRGACN